MSEEKFDFIFVIDKKSYLKYGTMNYELFIKEIFEYANYFSGDYEINFKNEEEKFEELTSENFEEFVNFEDKEIHFNLISPTKKISKLIEKINQIIKIYKIKFLTNFYLYMKKEKEKRKLELSKKLLLNKIPLINSQQNNYEKKNIKTTFYGYNRIRGENEDDMLEQASVRQSGVAKFGNY